MTKTQIASGPWVFRGDIVKVLITIKTGACPVTVNSSIWMALLFLMIVPSKVYGAAFNMLKITDVEGSFRLGYSLTETDINQTDGMNIFESRPGMEQELDINAHGYVFHPNFLEMELGAGLLFGQEELESNSGTFDRDEEYYDFSGRFNFLKQKPYPFNLYYIQRNPKQSVGIADRLNVEMEEYGAAFFLRSPLVDNPMSLEFDHTSGKGESTFTVIDDSKDSVTLNIQTRLGDSGSGRIGISQVSQTSGSGSRNLPVQESTNETDTIDWDGNFTLGAEDNIDFSNHLFLSSSEQNIAPSRDQVTFHNHINWHLSEATDTYNTYNYSSTDYGGIESLNQNFVIGSIRRYGDRLTLDGSINTSEEENEGFDRTATTLSGGLLSQTQISERWTALHGYSLNYASNSQASDQFSINVIDERHTFSGISSVTLANEYVVPGSVTLTNETSSQVFVEDIDYRIITIGSETRIERIISGNISDGQTVLVSYEYETGGTFDFDQFGQTFHATYSLDQRYNFSLLYSSRKQFYQSGIPTHSLESVKNYRVGMDAQIPINKTADYGWKLEFEKRKEESNPYTRETIELNLNSSLPVLASFMTVNTGYEYIDNELSPNDIREKYITTSISARTGWRSTASFEWTYRKDDGGDIPKVSKITRLRYDWSRGLLDFELIAKHSKDERGVTSRENSLIEASLTRVFR